MDSFKLGLIGAGNMACAILKGILKRRLLPAEAITLSDPVAQKREELSRLGVGTTEDNAQVCKVSDVIVLSIKPQMFDQVLPGLVEELKGKCVISISPGYSVAYLKACLPGAHVVRAMPNTPLLVGMGATAIVRSPEVPARWLEAAAAIFEAAGVVEWITEDRMDAVIAASGSSPAYFFRMADAMVQEAARQGLDPAVALRMVAHTMAGAAEMLLHAGPTPRELTEMVCSPGGTTLAALSAFDDMEFDGLIAEAMRRCIKRSGELGK